VICLTSAKGHENNAVSTYNQWNKISSVEKRFSFSMKESVYETRKNLAGSCWGKAGEVF
jgi:hypothetical protein